MQHQKFISTTPQLLSLNFLSLFTLKGFSKPPEDHNLIFTRQVADPLQNGSFKRFHFII